MRPRTFAHLSDLHIGRSAPRTRAAAALCAKLEQTGIEHLIVTGDITHRGRRSELEKFYELFKPFASTGRLHVLPGNHDRMGDDAAASLMKSRVEVDVLDGLYLVRVDSTAHHNRSSLASHGEMCHCVLEEVSQAMAKKPRDSLCVLALHHHLVPLPADSLGEWLSVRFGWPFTDELPLGERLLHRILDRCDLVLHGHRHVPRVLNRERAQRQPLPVLNAGSSTELSAVRIFSHWGGELLHAPYWLDGARRRGWKAMDAWVRGESAGASPMKPLAPSA